MIINWAKDKASLTSLELIHWCENVRILFRGFSWLDFRHVYREHNQSANNLSKDALALAPGVLHFTEVIDGSTCMIGEFELF